MSRFVKARELIKEDKRTVYVISEEVYLNLDEACLQAATSKVYESLRKKYILHHSILKWDKECVDILNRRSKKLATRLEREFMRGEELEKIDHVLKLSHLYFDAVKNGTKTAEIRFNDRGFKVGDVMSLNEIDSEGNLTNREPIRCLITHILEDNKYLQEGYVMLSFKLLEVSSE